MFVSGFVYVFVEAYITFRLMPISVIRLSRTACAATNGSVIEET